MKIKITSVKHTLSLFMLLYSVGPHVSTLFKSSSGPFLKIQILINMHLNAQWDPKCLHFLCYGKGLPQQAEVAQGVPGRLRPRIVLTFGTTRVVGRQPYAPAAFTPGEILGTHF